MKGMVLANNKFRKALTVLTAAVVLLGSFLAFTQPAKAATQYKYFYVMTKSVSEYTSDGMSYTTTEKNSYYDTGLLKKNEIVCDGDFSEAFKNTYTRYKNGQVKTTKVYNLYWIHPLQFYTKTTLEKGKPKKDIIYAYDNDGIRYRYGTKTYTYKSGKLSKTVQKGTDQYGTVMKETITYYKNGNPKKQVYTDSNTNGSTKSVREYDKNGYPVKHVYTDSYGTETYVYKNTYNKKGDPTKIVANLSYTPAVGSNTSAYSIKFVTTYKYTYKHGNIIKCVQTQKSTQDNGYTSTNKTTTKYSYKKVKVAKKYWKFF